MYIAERLSDKKEWLAFFSYKSEQGGTPEKELTELKQFIEREEYRPVVARILENLPWDPPQKLLISKSSGSQKRIVYSFGREENYVLKFLAFLLREYDGIFASNLYSFRTQRGVKQAIQRLAHVADLGQYYSYKVDIKSYFNSANVDIVLSDLQPVLQNNEPIFSFFEKILKDPRVEYKGTLTEEEKGILPGVPVSNFLANLYLRELDFFFERNRILYARYSDDIIVFSKTEEELQQHISVIKAFLSQRMLSVNPSKEKISLPHQPWDFLGFSYQNGEIDICEVSLKKLKAKMKRKTRALARWAERKNLPGELAARAFIKKFNAKLYDNPIHNELTWTRWFFPIINTPKSLHTIDVYMQECIRYLATGKRTNAKYAFRYDDMKTLGYRNLVHAYYEYKASVEENDPTQ